MPRQTGDSPVKTHRSLLIGLTGGPGAGKSAVAELLAAKGAAIICGDELGRRALSCFPEIHKAIRERFGEGLFTVDGELKRREFGRIVFTRDGEPQWLNSLMFPKIYELLQSDIQRYRHAYGVIVVDAAMIFEWGIEKEFDSIWVVIAPRELAENRMTRSGRLTVEEIRMRLAVQIPPEEKARRAHVVISNSGNRKQLQQVVNCVWKSEVSPWLS